MKCRDQSSHLWLFDVLQFVDKEHDGGTGRPSCNPNLLQKRTQISFKIAVIGQARLRIVIEPDFNVGVGQFELAGKTCQRLETSNGIVLRSLFLAEVKQRKPERGGQKSGE